MVTIAGKLNDSNLTGVVRATPDHPFVDTTTTPDTLVSLPYQSAIAAGEFSITVPQSEDLFTSTQTQAEGVTYKWELFRVGTEVTYQLLDGTPYTGTVNQWTDNHWYTGSIYEDGVSRRLDRIETQIETQLQPPIHAIAPNVANVEFTELFGIPSQQPGWDITIARLAELLTTNQVYRDRISSTLQFRGAYDPGISYLVGDVVSYDGGSYAYKNDSSQSGQTPPTGASNEYWQLISTKGDPGGTGATIVGYSSAWDGSADAAARNDVYDEIELVKASIPASQDLSAYLTTANAQTIYAPKTDPVFNGSNVERDPIAYPGAGISSNTEIPTMAWVYSAIADGSTVAKPVAWLARNAQQNFTAGSRGSIIWDTTKSLNTAFATYSSGALTFGATGRYLFAIALNCYVRSSPNVGRALLEAFIYRSSPSAGDLSLAAKLNLASTANLSFFTGLFGQALVSVNAGDAIAIQYSISSQANGINAGADVHHLASGGSGANTNSLIVWKVA